VLDESVLGNSSVFETKRRVILEALLGKRSGHGLK